MVIAGEEEAKEGKCKVKDLKARTEDTVDVGDLVKTLRDKGVVPVGCKFAIEMLQKENHESTAAVNSEQSTTMEGNAPEEEQERRMASIWVKPVPGVDHKALFGKIKDAVGDTSNTEYNLQWDDNVKVENGNLYVTFTIALAADFDEEVMEVIECMEDDVADQGVVFQTAME